MSVDCEPDTGGIKELFERDFPEGWVTLAEAEVELPKVELPEAEAELPDARAGLPERVEFADAELPETVTFEPEATVVLATAPLDFGAVPDVELVLFARAVEPLAAAVADPDTATLVLIAAELPEAATVVVEEPEACADVLDEVAVFVGEAAACNILVAVVAAVITALVLTVGVFVVAVVNITVPWNAVGQPASVQVQVPAVQ